MPNSSPDIELTEEWQSVYSLIGATPGQPLTIENTGANTAELHVSQLPPPNRPANAGATLIYPLETKYLYAGNLGLYARARPNSPNTKLNVSISGGLHNKQLPPGEQALIFDNIEIEIEGLSQPINTEDYVLFTNLTQGVIGIEQIANYQSIPDGATDGVSAIDLFMYVNPDLTGTSTGTQAGTAFRNDNTGVFEDLTGLAVDILNLDGFDTVANTQRLRLGGGIVSYYSTNQSTAVVDIDTQFSYAHPIFIAPGDSIVLVNRNTQEVDAGSASTSLIYLSGRLGAKPVNFLPGNEDFDSDFDTDFD